jgi:hypothetical protein
MVLGSRIGVGEVCHYRYLLLFGKDVLGYLLEITTRDRPFTLPQLVDLVKWFESLQILYLFNCCTLWHRFLDLFEITKRIVYCLESDIATNYL